MDEIFDEMNENVYESLFEDDKTLHVSDARFPLTNGYCSIFNTQCSLLDAKYLMLMLAMMVMYS